MNSLNLTQNISKNEIKHHKILCMTTCNYYLQKCQPRLDMLFDILNKNPYS